MNDRELLELAAKAAGRCIVDWIGDGNWVSVAVLDDGSRWQPLHENQFTDCMGDALRLAVKPKVCIRFSWCGHDDQYDSVWAERGRICCNEEIGITPSGHQLDEMAATRRAIVRAAAEIGKAMP